MQVGVLVAVLLEHDNLVKVVRRDQLHAAVHIVRRYVALDKLLHVALVRHPLALKVADHLGADAVLHLGRLHQQLADEGIAALLERLDLVRQVFNNLVVLGALLLVNLIIASIVFVFVHVDVRALPQFLFGNRAAGAARGAVGRLALGLQLALQH